MILNSFASIQPDDLGADPREPWTVHARIAPRHRQPDVLSATTAEVPQGEWLVGRVIIPHGGQEEWLELVGHGYVPLWLLHRVHPENDTPGDLPIGGERVNRWWGVPAHYTPTDLVPLPPPCTTQEPEKQYLLRRDAARALTAMVLEARHSAGIDLRVGSAFRPWTQQKKLYDAAIERSGPGQRYSAPPGHSEHQLGTAVDLTDPELTHFLLGSFASTPQYAWLRENAARHGFQQSYLPENVERTGYIAEPWHWRYIRPESDGAEH